MPWHHFGVAPSQGREFKHQQRQSHHRNHHVAPSQGRELKLFCVNVLKCIKMSPLHRGVN